MGFFERKIELFVYDDLKPDQNPPLSLHGWVPDKAEGYLVRMKPKPLFRAAPSYGHWVEGVTMVIHPEELPLLDRRVGEEYKRIRIITYLGFKAYVYVSKSTENIPIDSPTSARVINEARRKSRNDRPRTGFTLRYS